MPNTIKSHQIMHLDTSTTIGITKTKIVFKVEIRTLLLQKDLTTPISRDPMDGFMKSKIKMLYKITLKEMV